jgi:hypothetical protein
MYVAGTAKVTRPAGASSEQGHAPLTAFDDQSFAVTCRHDPHGVAPDVVTRALVG